MENTARKYQNYEEVPNNVQTEVRRQSKKVPYSTKEALLVAASGALIMILMVTLVSIKVGITASQQRLQQVSDKTEKITNKNVVLRQEIGELTSSQRLTEYAKNHDMVLSDKNVRNVSK